MSDYLAHDPNAGPLSYSMDFVDWLADGETLDSVSWEISPAGPVLSDEAASGSIGSVNVDGGTAGTVYRLRCIPISDNAQLDARSLILRCDLL